MDRKSTEFKNTKYITKLILLALFKKYTYKKVMETLYHLCHKKKEPDTPLKITLEVLIDKVDYYTLISLIYDAKVLLKNETMLNKKRKRNNKSEEKNEEKEKNEENGEKGEKSFKEEEMKICYEEKNLEFIAPKKKKIL